MVGYIMFIHHCCLVILCSYTIVVWLYHIHTTLLFGYIMFIQHCCLIIVCSYTIGVWLYHVHTPLLVGYIIFMQHWCLVISCSYTIVGVGYIIFMQHWCLVISCSYNIDVWLYHVHTPLMFGYVIFMQHCYLICHIFMFEILSIMLFWCGFVALAIVWLIAVLSGIPPHMDNPTAFADGILSLSCGSQVSLC